MSRRSRAEIGTNEQHVSDLVRELRIAGDTVSLDLAGRLWRCQQQRVERRAGLRDRVDRPCRHVACPFCRPSRCRRWQACVEQQMHHADNAQCSMITLYLERMGSLGCVQDAVEEFRVALRNLRFRRAADDQRWRALSMVGVCEVELMQTGDLSILPPSRRSVISALPARSHCDENTITIHAHLAVHHPRLPRHVVERAFTMQWPGMRRVDVRPFCYEVSGAENCARIVGYGAKHAMEIAFSGDVEANSPNHDVIELPVSMRMQAEYWSWLHGIRRGLVPLRIRMAPMGAKAPIRKTVAHEPTPIEPMPMVW